ncbi:MAG: hypothetical protein JOY78_13625, partial [Pseudonocardia sp.]|nr:hypothetical protein [Pseudonocardia sp.]
MTTDSRRPSAAPAPGSRAVPDEAVPDGTPEADAHGAPVPGTDTDGPDVGERAAEYREPDAGPVGPTAVDPVAPDGNPLRRGRRPNGPVMLGSI